MSTEDALFCIPLPVLRKVPKPKDIMRRKKAEQLGATSYVQLESADADPGSGPRPAEADEVLAADVAREEGGSHLEWISEE